MKYIAAAVFIFALVVGTLSLHNAALDPNVSVIRFSILVGVFGSLFCASGLILDFDTMARRHRIELAEEAILKDVDHIRNQAAQADRIVRNLRARERELAA